MKTSNFRAVLLASGVAAFVAGSSLELWPGPAWIVAEDGVALLRSQGNDGADAPSGRLVLRMPAAEKAEPSPEHPPSAPEELDAHPPVEPIEPVIEEEAGGDGICKRVLIAIDQGGLMRMREKDVSMEDANGNLIPNPSRWHIALLEMAKIISELDDDDEYAVYRFFGGY